MRHAGCTGCAWVGRGRAVDGQGGGVLCEHGVGPVGLFGRLETVER